MVHTSERYLSYFLRNRSELKSSGPFLNLAVLFSGSTTLLALDGFAEIIGNVSLLSELPVQFFRGFWERLSFLFRASEEGVRLFEILERMDEFIDVFDFRLRDHRDLFLLICADFRWVDQLLIRYSIQQNLLFREYSFLLLLTTNKLRLQSLLHLLQLVDDSLFEVQHCK